MPTSLRCVKKRKKKNKGILICNISDSTQNVEKGLLGIYGYKISNSFVNRKIAIKNALKSEGSLPILRCLVSKRTYKKKDIKMFNKLDKDVKFVQKERLKIKKRVCFNL